MGFTRREFLAMASTGAAAAGLAGCSRAGNSQSNQQSATDDQSSQPDVNLEEFKDLAINMGSWKYDEDNNVYYQLGLAYCLDPATTTYESLAIFVPGDYFKGEKNGNSYTCTVDEKAVVGNFTAATAPVLMPINTATLAAQTSPTAYSYEGLAPYLSAGCIYVYAGFRGRSAGYDTASGKNELFPGGAPWPVVDLKAAIRYLRYNAESLPCDASRIFVFGFGAGGGVSAVLGSSGGSSLYEPYLSSIGAVTHDAKGNAISDAIAGSASWCPVTSYDTADAAYEWSCGQYSTEDTRAEGSWMSGLSTALATSYGEYVNQMDFRGADDEQLTLDETEGGCYTMGSYATALLANIDDAATWFVQNTPFPYTYTPQRVDEPSFPGDPNLLTARAAEAATAGQNLVTGTTSATGTTSTTGTTTTTTTTTVADDGSAAATDAADGTGVTTTAVSAATAAATTVATTTATGATQVQSTIYDSAQTYFSELNADYWWINYNLRKQSVSVSSLRDYAIHLRSAKLKAAPYDRPDRSSRSNQLFGIGEESTLHFDETIGQLIEKNATQFMAATDWVTSYITDWDDDLEKTDSLDTDMATRVSMMNPLYWLSGHYGGYGQASVAPHWRINEGLLDTDASACMAANLVFALSKYDGVADVAYTPVWGQGHVLAERSGSATSNLIQWVIACCG